MARVVLINIAMFLLPFIVYGAYLYLSRKDDEDTNYWRDAPIGWLFAIGMVLVFAVIISLIQFTGSGPGGHYVPPQFKDGKIVPGHVE